jgi:hypothetical protein
MQKSSRHIWLWIPVIILTVWTLSSITTLAQKEAAVQPPPTAPPRVIFVPMPCPETFPPSPTPTSAVVLPTTTPTPVK